jgi:hypothetical protein
MQGRHVILMVNDKGYVKTTDKLSYEFTSRPQDAKGFPERQVWHEETELLKVKQDMDNNELTYEDHIFEFESYKR